MQMMGLEEELVRMLGQDCPIPVTYAGGSELMVSLFVCIGMTNAFTDFKHTHPTPPPPPPHRATWIVSRRLVVVELI